MTDIIERKQVTATQLLQAMATAVSKDTNGNYIDFEFNFGHPKGELLLSFDLDGDQAIHIDTEVSYTVIDADYDGSAVCSDIDGIKVKEISVGNGYDQEVIEVADTTSTTWHPYSPSSLTSITRAFIGKSLITA